MRKSALVMGGNGALGKAFVNAFKARNWRVLCIDLHENSEADSNIVISPTDKVQDQMEMIYDKTQQFGKELDSIMCVAGGFDVSSIKDEDVFQRYLHMDRVNFQSALLAGHLSTSYLAPRGFLMFTGAAAVFEGPVNFAYGYAMSKAATHHLALQMAERTEIPESSKVVTILPQIIDTPANREAMADADKSDWQPPAKIAELVRGWAEGDNTPENGSFAKLKFENGCIIPEFV